MRRGERAVTRPRNGYVLAVVATAIAVAVRWLLDPVLGDRVPMVLTLPAVAAASWFGGYRPALLAAVLGYLVCAPLFLEPRGSLSFEGGRNAVQLFGYLFACSIIIGLGEALRVARKRAGEQRERLSVTLANIRDAVVTCDRDGRVTYLNATAEALLGWTQEEAAGQPFDSVFRIANEQPGEEVESPAAHAMRECARIALPTRSVLIAKDGGRRSIDGTATPIRDDTDGLAGCVLVFQDVTDRRRVENALERSERDLFDFFENASVGLHWAGPDGTILRVNETELTLLGYAREEYVGRNIADFHVDRPFVEDMLARLARGEAIRDHRARMRHRDGSSRDVLISANVLIEDGQIVHIRRFTRDVTDLRRARETHALLGAIVESSDDAIVSKTLDGIVLSWNTGAQNLFGYTPEEMIGKPITRIIPEKLIAEEHSILERLRRGERIEHYETERVSKDGRRVHISLTISPIRDDTGRIVGASKVARDISGRKAADEKLRETELRFRLFADSAPILMWLNDASGCVFVNRAYLDFLGVPHQADVRGYEWAQYIHPEDRDAYVARYRECEEHRAPFAAEFRFRRRDGEYRWMHSAGVPRISESGEYLGYTGCTLDVHENRVVTQALQEADRRKNEFLATLAHELRNPLAPLGNMLEVMKRAGGDRDLIEKARGTMERQMASLVRLVDDLLDLSRITLDKVELRKERVDLARVLQQALETCGPLIEGFKHDVTLSMPTEPVHLHADPERLSQVFNNLLNNACKYSEPQSRISVTVERQGQAVAVRFKDSGFGIPPESLETIFEMFTQGGSTGERGQSGLGIGLTLVRRLVELHEGTVEAFSEGAGRGSEFVVRLPLPIEAPEARRASVPIGPDGAAPRRVLVVDDNLDSAASLALLLKVTGEETYMAHDGLEAVAAAEQHRPDVVLLDLGLPNLNGFDAARRIREQPWGRDMVLIALTGWGQEEDRRKSKEAGFDAHLVKPVDYVALRKLLASLPETAGAAGPRSARAPSSG